MKDLRSQIEKIYEDNFDETCRKFSGALTVELIRQRLKKIGIPVSPRDVFIKGVPIEIDLLIPKPGARPGHNIIYEPEDVVAVLEIKYRGAFSREARDATRDNFRKIKRHNERIQCIYLAVTETRGYKWAVYQKDLGFPAYTLNWWSNTTKKHTQSRGWDKLVDRLSQAIKKYDE